MSNSVIRLMHYDPRWRQEFQQTRSSILFSCSGWVTAVEHIGSTAIPGLIARPIIDCIACVADDSGFPPAVLSIEGLNYRRVEPPAWAGSGIVMEKPRYAATHCVVLTQAESSLWQTAISIRENLIANPELAIRFEHAKVDRWRSGEGDPERYSRDKAIFFSHLIDQLPSDRPD